MLVTEENEDGVEISYYLENGDGEKIAEYDKKPSHPSGTANDIVEDLDLDPSVNNAILLLLKQNWDWKTKTVDE